MREETRSRSRTPLGRIDFGLGASTPGLLGHVAKGDEDETVGSQVSAPMKSSKPDKDYKSGCFAWQQAT